MVTVIICARNAAGHLRRSLPAVVGQDYPSHCFKILVIDNASTDDTAEVAREHGAIVRSCPRPGVVHARDMGWRSAETALIAFLDADCEPPPDWLSRLVEHFENDPKLGAAGVRLVPGEVKTLAERHIVAERILDTDRFWKRNALQFPFLVTAGLMVRRAALEAVGGFDTTLGRRTGEDADLCWKLDRVGWKLYYDRDLEVTHHHRATIRAMMRQAYWYGRSQSALFARWRDELGWRRYTDWGPYRRLVAALIVLPGALFTSIGYHRFAPLLRLLDTAAFLVGKWRGSAEERVLFL